MKIFFDTEFTGLHKNTTLISIGLVTENGEKFYGKFSDYDKNQCNEWINRNVINNLKIIDDEKDSFGTFFETSGSKRSIKAKMLFWLKSVLPKDNESVELVSDVAHYDMTLFVDIFGTAFDLPKFITAACIDLNQIIMQVFKFSLQEAFDCSRENLLEYIHPSTKLVFVNNKHNSLYDACVIKEIYENLEKIKDDDRIIKVVRQKLLREESV